AGRSERTAAAASAACPSDLAGRTGEQAARGSDILVACGSTRRSSTVGWRRPTGPSSPFAGRGASSWLSAGGAGKREPLMSQRLDLGDPIAVLLTAVKALRDAGIETVVYGGLALAVYGEPRETRDADLAALGVAGSTAEAAMRR